MDDSSFPPAVARERKLEHELQSVRIAVQAAKLFTAGTVAGLVECLASYPLDTIKTRMQTQGGSMGALSSFAAVVREDGALALYRGMSSRLVASMVACSILFSTNGTLKELLHADSNKPLSSPFMTAAAGTGVIEALVFCPLELVKTRMQVLRGSHTKLTTWSTAVGIYRQHGVIKGWYRGASSLVLREGIGNLAYFTSYECGKQMLVEDTSGPGPGPGAGILAIAGAGGVAGMLYGLVIHPIDTVKSLVQTDSLSAPKYRGFVDGLRQAVAREGGGVRGFMGLYRGLSPALARAFVGNAVLFLTLEATLDAMGR